MPGGKGTVQENVYEFGPLSIRHLLLQRWSPKESAPVISPKTMDVVNGGIALPSAIAPWQHNPRSHGNRPSPERAQERALKLRQNYAVRSSFWPLQMHLGQGQLNGANVRRLKVFERLYFTFKVSFVRAVVSVTVVRIQHGHKVICAGTHFRERARIRLSVTDDNNTTARK